MAQKEPTNGDRAIWAHDALDVFSRATMGGRAFRDLGEDRQDAFSDLLCDLMHLADFAGLDWGRALSAAESNYQGERYEEQQAIAQREADAADAAAPHRTEGEG